MRIKTAGFTAIEVLVVVTMVGILGAIAAPGWLSFMTRQRLNTAREEVLQILSQAQSDAQQNRLTRIIELDSTSGDPALRISDSVNPSLEQTLGDGTSEIQLQVFGRNNTPATSFAFDYQGHVVPDPTLSVDSVSLPIFIKLSAVDSGVPQRCVVVTTLLGNMVMAEGGDCDADAWNSR